MKDIDFDELDKAVNSLMTKKQSQKSADNEQPAAPSAPPVDTPDVPDTAAPVSPGTVKPKSEHATNPDAQPAVTPEPKSTPSAAPATRPGAPANRRSGRFMDVVPKKSTAAAPTRPVSREGTTVAPRSKSLSTPAPSTPTPEKSTPAAQPAPQPKTPPITEKTAPTSDWPDPIEMTGPQQPVAKKPETPQPKAESAPPDAEEKPKEQPLSSPFLPDAKVEKRPLGSSASSAPPSEDESKVSTPDDSAAQLPAQPGDVPLDTPEEFRHDLMKVESDTHMGVPKTEPPKGESQVETEEQPEPEPEKEKPTTKPPKVTEKAEDLTASEAPSGRISIPPQYKEQPSTGEKESGAIYDTSTYHQPLAHPAKKKTGWLWVLWIVLILIVGAAAGAALYFLGVM